MRYTFNLIMCFFLSPFIASLAQIKILPVELTYFKYQTINTHVLLSWGTATETNCYGFNIERFSDASWATIGFVHGSFISNSPKDYSFQDTSINSLGNYLYRLKQIDSDGSFKYSDTLSVSILTSIPKNNKIFPSHFSVSRNYPNPFNPSTNIQVKLSKSSELILKVFNIRGEIIIEKNYGFKAAGNFILKIDLSNFSSGIYFYSITADKISQTSSMIFLK